MKENKEKELASGDEIIQVEDVAFIQTRPGASKTLKLVPLSSSEKRKAVSMMVDIGNLPSCQRSKRPKVDSSIHAKAPIVELDPPAVETPVVVPLEVPSSKTPSCLDSVLSTVPHAEDPVTASHTFLRSEALAKNRFKIVVKQEDVMACYDMSIKEFERSIIHDLFKVFFFIHSNSYILLLSYILTFYSYRSCLSLWRCPGRP